MTSARLSLALAAALIPALLAGCGGSSGQEKPLPKLAIKIEQFGPETQVGVTKNVAAGVQQASFTNKAKGRHSAQLIRYEPGHDPQEALKAAQAWGEHGKPLPDWIHLAGGFGKLGSGATSEGAVKFEPGAYLVVDLEARGKPVYGQFNTVGPPGKNPLPTTTASIKAAEYSFSASGLASGNHRVLFDNTGSQPHMLAAAPLAKGATLADVRRYVKSGKGKAPIDQKKSFDLAVIDGHTSQDVQLNLTRGKYALFCFVSDRKGGPPHVAKGMISLADVR
jgi:hypothetical protein